jgi:hypothetical protein
MLEVFLQREILENYYLCTKQESVIQYELVSMFQNLFILQHCCRDEIS